MHLEHKDNIQAKRSFFTENSKEIIDCNSPLFSGTFSLFILVRSSSLFISVTMKTHMFINNFVPEICIFAFCLPILTNSVLC